MSVAESVRCIGRRLSQGGAVTVRSITAGAHGSADSKVGGAIGMLCGIGPGNFGLRPLAAAPFEASRTVLVEEVEGK